MGSFGNVELKIVNVYDCMFL